MRVRFWDLETDGLLDEVSKLNSLVIRDRDDQTLWNCAPPSHYERFERGIDVLMDSDVIVGHNIISYDIPVLDKLYPGWRPQRRNSRRNGPLVLDTLVLSRLLWPSEVIRERDFTKAAKGLFPKQLIGRYSLEAWGYRLGDYKGDFKGPWDTWTEEMQDYCVQDVQVTAKLFEKCMEKLQAWGIDPFDRNPAPGKDCVQLEHDVAWIIARQERRGFAFDAKTAAALYGKLSAMREELSSTLAQEFPPDVIKTTFTPKSSNSKLGYVKGVPFTKTKVVPFNPGSRKQVAERLLRLGWKPEEFTGDGTPKIDDDILTALPFPEAKRLAEYFTIEKRLGQIGDGKEAWLRAEKHGRIHGRAITNGAVTGRMTHQSPNLAQVPTSHKPWGKECRSLFMAGPGYVLVGCDADALELRCLADAMAQFDDGAYIETVLNGKKELGTDMHSVNAAALGLTRDTAKTWFYAFIYGAGDWKLGFTATGLKGPRQKIARRGSADRAQFLTKLPAMGALVKSIRRIVEGVKDSTGKLIRKGRNWLLGIDGRRITVRSSHAALNTKLQSAGALAMKRALVILDERLQETFTAGEDYEFVGNIHDEYQIEARPEHAEQIGTLAAEAIKLAGDYYGFKCPLKGNYVVGKTWADTH